MPLFQVITRNNKPGEKAYSLFVVYDRDGSIAWMAEARSSNPGYRDELIQKGHTELITLHLEPRTYNMVRDARKDSISFFLVS